MSEILGKPLLRKEDPALLSGRGRFADDLPVPAGTLHAHVVRSPTDGGARFTVCLPLGNASAHRMH